MNNPMYVVTSESYGRTSVLGVFDDRTKAESFQLSYSLSWNDYEKGYTPSLGIQIVEYDPEPPCTDHLRIPDTDYTPDDEEMWDGIPDISIEESNACDHYNERYSY